MVGFERTKKQVYFKDSDYALAGAASGFITRSIFQPLDVLKIRFQLQIEPISKKSNLSKYKGTVHGFKSILKEEGARAFWKGMVPAQLLSISYGSLQFYTFELLTAQVNQHVPDCILTRTKPLINFTCGALAGCLATTGSFPFDTLRTRLVAQGEPKTYQGVYHAASTMLKNEGIFSFYKGLTPTLVQIMPNTGAQFAFYYIFQELWSLVFKPEATFSSAAQNGFCGAAAGVAAKITIYPLDLIKKRIQVQGFEEARKSFGTLRKYTGMLNCVRSILKEERFFGLYKGLWPSVLKAALTTGSHFLFYEKTLKLIAYTR